MNEILQKLAEAWNLYLEAYPLDATASDTDDRMDFKKTIHDAQRIVMAKEGIKKDSQ